MDEFEHRTAQGLDLPKASPVYRRPLIHIERHDHMPGPDGPGTGISVRDAIRMAEQWWDKVGRVLVKGDLAGTLNPEQGGIGSGIMRGLAWGRLSRDECEQVIRTFNALVVIPRLRQVPPGDTFILDELAHRGHVSTRAAGEVTTNT